MISYFIRRLLLLIPTMLLITIIVFISVRFIPGDVVDQMAIQHAGIPGASFDRQALEQQLGLDVPVHIQYIRWMGKILLHADLGVSLWGGIKVTDKILTGLPITAELGLLSILIALLLAVPIGIYSAVRQNSIGDLIGRSFAILCIALPSFWIAVMVMLYPAKWWGWSPSIQYIPITKNLGENLVQFIVPATILGMSLTGMTMRVSRTMMLEVLRQDYIRTAWAKGLSERVIIMRHALRNALIPVVTLIGLFIPTVIGGAVIIEQIFALPGLGRLMLNSLFARDYPIVSGLNLLVAIVVVLVNLMVDVTYSYLDPRIRYK